jgi:gluconolactonase
MILERFARGLRFPEGPVWMPDGSVLVTEIVGRSVRRCFPDSSSKVVATMNGGPNGAALGPDGAAYICNSGGMAYTEVQSRGWILPGEQPEDYCGGSVQRVDLKSGSVSTLYTECAGNLLRGPNDLVFDASGGIWFTDHGKIRARDRDRGALYYAAADGSAITEVLMPLDSPNGVGISPDGKRLYVAETFVARVWAWDIEAPGVLKIRPRHRAFGAELMVGLGGYHVLDSMAIDIDGNICVATIGDNNGITVIAPNRSSVRHIQLPGPMPTNICFGGSNLDQAYATLSVQGELVSWKWSPSESPVDASSAASIHLG